MVTEVKKGYTEIRFSTFCGLKGEEELAQFYQAEDKIAFINEEFLSTDLRQKDTDIAICDNEYLIIKLDNEIVDKMRCKNGELIPLKYNRVYSTHLGKMSPRNI